MSEPELAGHPVRASHDFQVNPGFLPYPDDAVAGVAPIGPELQQRLVLGVRQFDDVYSSVVVLDIGRVDQDFAGKSKGVND